MNKYVILVDGVKVGILADSYSIGTGTVVFSKNNGRVAEFAKEDTSGIWHEDSETSLKYPQD